MSESADLLQQLLAIREKVAAENLSGGRSAAAEAQVAQAQVAQAQRPSPAARKSSKRGKTKYATAATSAGKKQQVWEGRAEKTCPNGLTKKELMVNKSGKIVSKKASAAAKRRLRQNPRLAAKNLNSSRDL